jgi:hypothetical protein
MLTKDVFNWKHVIIQVWRYRDIIHVNHASHTVSIFQYVHALNLLSYVRYFDKLFHSLWTWYQGENQSLTALFWKDNGYQIDDICHKEQWKLIESALLKSRRVIERPILSDRHQRWRLAWCLARRGLNLRTRRRIHWLDESRFLLHVPDEQWEFGDSKIRYTLKEHSANCPLFFLVIVLTV